MDLRDFLDSTFLKNPSSFNNDEHCFLIKFTDFVNEAVAYQFKLIMVYPEYVTLAKQILANSKVQIGTVIGFPLGNHSIEDKLLQANKAINDGAHDLDFVINYQAFLNNEFELVKNEVLQGCQLAYTNQKVIKWIIETAALSVEQIAQIATLIKKVVLENFPSHFYKNVFVKSSTGFYSTKNGTPNGATIEAITVMINNASPLSIKASGGIKSQEQALAFIQKGVLRIGTSSAKEIVQGTLSSQSY